MLEVERTVASEGQGRLARHELADGVAHERPAPSPRKSRVGVAPQERDQVGSGRQQRGVDLCVASKLRHPGRHEREGGTQSLVEVFRFRELQRRCREIDSPLDGLDDLVAGAGFQVTPVDAAGRSQLGKGGRLRLRDRQHREVGQNEPDRLVVLLRPPLPPRAQLLRNDAVAATQHAAVLETPPRLVGI